MCRCVTYAFWYVAASAVPYRETFHQVLTNTSWPNKCECFVWSMETSVYQNMTNK